MSSTFSGFYVAKSGIQAARANLEITGQNMTNVNTEGYTRQRVDTSTVGSSTSNMRYANTTDLNVGGGVKCDSVSQMRDAYLDVRYRLQNAKVGDTSTQADILSSIENILDESEGSGLDSLFSNVITELQNLSTPPIDSVSESIVKTSCLLLTQSFNDISHQIEEVRNKAVGSLETEQVSQVNNLLKNISYLNSEIKSADVSGSPALELLDQRNTMLDQLSKYVNIEVTQKEVGVGGGKTVYELSVDLVSGDQKFNLVSNDDYRQFDLQKNADTGALVEPIAILLRNSDGSLVSNSNTGAGLEGGKINDYLTVGTLHGSLAMINGKGAFAQDGESTDRGIGYYETLLDGLAQSFADIMNRANSTSDSEYNKPLFTTTDGSTTTGITAGNISLSNAWENSSGTYITATKNEGDATGNILHMISELSKQRTYSTPDGKEYFTGSFRECVSNASLTLALQLNDVDRQNSTYTATLDDIDEARQAYSSVDTNEEAINMIMYNQALTAASRFMTTMDEALDTIINRTGVVGR